MKYPYLSHIIFAAFISLLTSFTSIAQSQHRHNTSIYAVKPDGTVLYYNYKGASDGSPEWDAPVTVRTDWQDMHNAFSSKGKIYLIKNDGVLLWYHHNGVAGDPSSWNGPKKVGVGWQDARLVFNSGGRIYTVRNDGTLWWYNHTGATDGSFRWKDAQRVGSDWQNITKVFSCDGKIYAIRNDGDLLWYNHTGAAGGTKSWVGANRVGNGWQDAKQAFGAQGIIYVIKNDGTLWWYHHKGIADGSFDWDTPKQIGTGWDQFTKVFAIQTEDTPEPTDAPPPVSSQPETYTVTGPIADKYNKLGSLPGKPLSNQQLTGDGKGMYQTFQGCNIYWHPDFGEAFEVHGLIRDMYLAKGNIKGPGYPVTDERTCTDGRGKYNIFKGKTSDGKWALSAIYLSPSERKVYPIYGAIYQKWKDARAEAGVCGYPTSEEQDGGRGERYQNFQNRVIRYIPSKGTFIELPKVM